MTDYEAKLLEEITKIRVMMASMLAREEAYTRRLDLVEKEAQRVGEVCEKCPARLRSLGLTAALRDVILVTGAVSGIAAVAAMGFKVLGVLP